LDDKDHTFEKLKALQGLFAFQLEVQQGFGFVALFSADELVRGAL
jgi:hypothetical protein